MNVCAINNLFFIVCIVLVWKGVGVFRHLGEVWHALNTTSVNECPLPQGKPIRGSERRGKREGCWFTLFCLCAEFAVGHSLHLLEVYNFHWRLSIFLLLLSSLKPGACVRHSWASQTRSDPLDFFFDFLILML